MYMYSFSIYMYMYIQMYMYNHVYVYVYVYVYIQTRWTALILPSHGQGHEQDKTAGYSTTVVVVPCSLCFLSWVKQKAARELSGASFLCLGNSA